MKFIFKAKNQTGEVKEGKVDAISQEAAIQTLQSNGLVPMFVQEEKDKATMVKDIRRIWEGVNQRELAVIFRQLATLIDAKISIVTALQAVGQQTENAYLKTVIFEISDDVQDGMPFSEALSRHPDVFTTLMVSMIRAGEVSGNLQRSVMFIAENTEKNNEMSSKIKSALFYPIFVFCAASIIGFLVFTIVLPKLTGIFKEMKVEIPWYTKALMGLGDFFASYWWAVIIVVLFAAAGLIYYIKTEDGKREWDHAKLKIPVFGSLFRYIYLARFSENLSVLLVGGIPIVRALVIVSDVVNNGIYQKVILRAADEVKSGGSMSNVLSRSSEFPPIVSQMIKIGEESGKISEVLDHIAIFYERETDRIARNMSTLIEPILIVILGIGVAILVFAILMPIYNLAGNL